jgi:hypothetical protein
MFVAEQVPEILRRSPSTVLRTNGGRIEVIRELAFVLSTHESLFSESDSREGI